MPTVIDADRVSKRFWFRHNRSGSLKERFLGLVDRRRRETAEEFWALRDLSLTIGRGESVGVIGRNGSGKSTLLKLIAGIHRPTAGTLRVLRGARIGTMIELGIGFHGELSGKENLFLNAAVHGLSRPEIERIYQRVVEYSGLAQFMDAPLKNFSSGMHMRLGFAISANLDPDILLLDEIFAVGDEDFQQKCMRTMEQFREEGRTIVFVSHAPAAVRAVCQRVYLLDAGRLLYEGDVEHGLEDYHRLLANSPRGAPLRGPSDPDAEFTASPQDDDRAWHRVAAGGRWREAGAWQFDLLRQHGLEPHQFVLDVGCGSLAGAVPLLTFMDQSHYWGYETERELFEAGVRVELPRAGVRPERGHFVINESFDFHEIPYRFDFAVANSMFRRLSLNRVAHCIASVLRQLQPHGQFFATWFDNPDPASFEPVERPGGVRTYADMPPYHYSFEMLTGICDALGARAERVDGPPHPRGESLMLLTRRD